MTDKIKHMSKDELLNSYNEICDQLREHKRLLEPYFGKPVEVDSEIAKLYWCTQQLFRARYDIKNELRTRYGLFIMDDDNF